MHLDDLRYELLCLAQWHVAMCAHVLALWPSDAARAALSDALALVEEIRG